MSLAISILLGLVGIICFLGGANIMIGGAMHFLPKEIPAQLVLDNLVRFLAGIYLGSGFLCAYATFHAESIGNIIYFPGLIVVFSGMGRLYSRLEIGPAGNYFDIIMVVEIVIGLSIILLKCLN
ncbi:MAG: DUF4345 domain-containing protein [Chitinophagaceae bacterium]|nr:DUF4345 domain-containing protein [Chitinophagaceae bacterium]